MWWRQHCTCETVIPSTTIGTLFVDQVSDPGCVRQLHLRNSSVKMRTLSTLPEVNLWLSKINANLQWTDIVTICSVPLNSPCADVVSVAEVPPEDYRLYVLDRSAPYLAQLIMSSRSRNMPKIVAFTVRDSCLQYGKVACNIFLLCLSFFFF